MSNNIDGLAARLMTPTATCPVCGASRHQGGDCYECMRREDALRGVRHLSIPTIPQSFRWATFDSPLLARRVDPAAIDVARSDLGFSRMVLRGPKPGTGKTSLAVAVMRAWMDHHVAAAHFTTAVAVARARFEHRLSEGGEAPAIARAFNVPLLVLDDLGQETHDPSGAVSHVIAERHAQGRPTIVTTFLEWKRERAEDGPGMAERYGGGIYRRLREDAVIWEFVVAPLRTLSRYVQRMARALVRELVRRAPQHVQVTQETAEGFQLRRHDGRVVALETFAASRATGRGVTILDEAQFFAGDDTFVVNDRDVWRAIVPRLRGPGIFLSTPWPTPTLMGELVKSDWAAPSKALVARAGTLLMRDGDPELARTIEQERLRDAENTAREWECVETSGTSGTFFDHAAVDGAVDDALPLSLPAPPGAIVAAGADLAFTSDSSALAIVARVGDRFSLLHLEELRPSKGNPLQPKAVIDTFASIAKRYGARSMMADAHYKESAREHLAPHGLSFDDAPGGITGKQAVYVTARGILHEARFTMARHARLVAQLRDVRSTPMPGGAVRIFSPRRAGLAHGDTVSALTLGLYAAKMSAGPSHMVEDNRLLASLLPAPRAIGTCAPRPSWGDDDDGGDGESWTPGKPLDATGGYGLPH